MSNIDISENIILKNLFYNPEYAKFLSPHLNPDFFNDYITKTIISKIIEYNSKYKEIPSIDTISYNITHDNTIDQNTIDKSLEVIENIKNITFENQKLDWLIDITEKRFQDLALQKAILKCADILSSEDKKKEKHTLPDLIKDALKISFKINLGMEYGSEKTIEEQFFYYHHQESIFPFHNWKYFNKILKGGARKKKLQIFLAPTSVGKCCVYNTKIKIKNKKTGEIKEILIGDFFEKIKASNINNTGSN